MTSSSELLASLGVKPTLSEPLGKSSKVTDLFPGSPDPLSSASPPHVTMAKSADATLVRSVPAVASPAESRGTTDAVWPEIPSQICAGSSPLSPLPPAEKTYATAAASPLDSSIETDLPAWTPLYVGETVVARMSECRRRVDERLETGQLFVTSCRIIWESPATPPSSTGVVLVFGLHSIDRFKRQKAPTVANGAPRGIDELSGAATDESLIAALSASSRLRMVPRLTKGNVSNGPVDADLYLKYSAWPALRLQLEEAAVGRLLQALNYATLTPPSRAGDPRADVSRSLAVLYASSLRGASEQRGGASMWTLYDMEQEVGSTHREHELWERQSHDPQ